MQDFSTKICTNCGSVKFKTWDKLTDDEKFLIERMPQSSNYSPKQRKKHHYCKRCFYMFEEDNQIV